MRSGVIAAGLALALAAPAAMADELLWMNVNSFPSDLEKTGWAWSNVRIEQPQFVSYRCAADDFVLTRKAKVTRIVFYSVKVGVPEILGGDWYIYEGGGAGPPGKLIAHGSGAPMAVEDMGVVNPAFGPVFANTLEPEGLVLGPGTYFLGFRTFQTLGATPEKNNNAGLTISGWSAGESPAWWSFGVMPDGVVVDPWVKMEVFNLQKEQEWAFSIYGEADGCYADCDGSGSLDIDDFLCFQLKFALADPYADCDNNSLLNIDDFLCYQLAFALGC